MIGSLVVGLPSAFNGGALEVEHRGETATYPGSKTALSFVAFYGDCRHQVKPVTSGYRVVLTYNLLLGTGSAAALEPPDSELVGSVARSRRAPSRRESASPAQIVGEPSSTSTSRSSGPPLTSR